MKRNITALVSVLALMGGAEAALVDRGGGMIYDTTRSITWLQDWNYAKTSGYDSDGVMSHTEATVWASQLAYAGYEDWRLPTMLTGNGTPCYNGGCLTGEMPKLWREELMNVVEYVDFKTGNFVNVVSGPYWSSTSFSYGASGWWYFSTSSGFSNASVNERDGMFAVAVRDGDVAAVPEPATIALVGAALLGITATRRSRPEALTA